MTPIKYAAENGVTTFYYDPNELAEFHRLGRQHGDVGMVLIQREGGMLTFEGYGVIENPCKTIQQFSIMHHPLFDGEMCTDEERLIPPKPFFTPENTKMIFLDFSKDNSV